jgi:4-amino-4-deoxy-L-arabinose transferase-like glycosyltransferase
LTITFQEEWAVSSQSSSPDRMQTGICLGAIAATALVVRLTAVFYLGNFRPPWMEDWDLIAQALVQTGSYGLDQVSLWGANPGHLTAFIPPMYPAFLALQTILFGGEAWLATRLVQAMVSVLAVLLVYLLGKEVFARDDVSLLGALLAALFPPLIGGVAQGNAGSFEIFFTELIVLLALRAARQASLWGWLWAGVVGGVAALTRSTALVLFPMLALWLWAGSCKPRVELVAKPLLVMGLSVLLVIGPWTIRNYRVFGALIPISSNGGINFWIGNNELATGEFVHPAGIAPELIASSAAMPEGARDRFFYGESFSFIRANPGRFVQLLGTKLLFFLWGRPSLGETYATQDATSLGVLAYLWANRLLLPVWLAGIVLTARNWRHCLILYATILTVLLVNVLYFAGARYQAPAIPFQILLASYAIVIVVSRIRRRGLRGAP